LDLVSWNTLARFDPGWKPAWQASIMNRSGGMQSSNAEAAFRTTCWTGILAVGDPDPEVSEQAFAILYRDYCRPLYAYARRRGRLPHESEDLVHDFFALLLEKRRLNEIRREGGRFRSFLLKSFQNHLLRDRERSQARKRGGDRLLVSFEGARVDGETTEVAESPEDLFDRDWAWQILENARARLREDYRRAGKEELLNQLEPLLVRSGRENDYQTASNLLNMSPAAFRVAVHRFRLRFGERLRTEIGRTVASPDEAREELRYLLRVLGGSGIDPIGGRDAAPLPD